MFKAQGIYLQIVFLCSLLYLAPVNAQTTLKQEKQIEAWLNKLSLEEKAGQLSLVPIQGEPKEEVLRLIREGKVGSVIKSHGAERNLALQKVAVEQSRAGVPILFQEDVIHGYKTIAPIPLAEAASWDLEAIRKSASVAAREASAAGIQLTYAPMVDISRDPRWGRGLEAAGEDPYLGALVAKARVLGFQQGSSDDKQNLLATVKHFAGYGASLAGRDYNIRDLSERELREVHLPPFQAAIDAGVSSVMGAYTAYDGIPATANTWLMNDLLRDEMGFKGLLMTDWETIPNLVKIGVAAHDHDAVMQSIAAGFDIDMTSQYYIKFLPDLVRKGLISEQAIDSAVRRVLRLKQKVGLLDAPYAAFDPARERAQFLSKQNWADTLDIARKSMVLLKNDEQLLPLTEPKKIAVIGPMAKAKKDLMGWWSAKGDPEQVVDIWSGLSKKFSGKAELRYAQGVQINKFEKVGAELIDEAVELATQSDIAIVVLGEQEWMSGEGGSTASLRLPGLQETLLAQIKKTGVKVVSIIISGRPYILTDVAENSDALLQAWMPGTTGGEAVADIISGSFNPSGRLPVTFPYHEGQVPIYYSYKKTSHSFDAGIENNRYSTTYRDVQNAPLYPFGYGLGFSPFDYGNINIDTKELYFDNNIHLSLKITNMGVYQGTETVQLYIRDHVAEVTRPIKELIDFKQVNLKPGESQQVTFTIRTEQLSYIGRDLKRRIDPGRFTAFIGSNSADLKSVDFVLMPQ